MSDTTAGGILSKIGIAIAAIAFVDLVYLNWWIFQSDKIKADQIEKSTKGETEQVTNSNTSTQATEPSPTALPSPSATPVASSGAYATGTTVVEKQTQTIIQNAQKEIFIPVGGGSTFSHDFADLAGTDITIDTGKYSAIEAVTFEASIWVDGGNGRAYAQIKNVTDNNPLIESQISNATGSGTVKTSSNIPMPYGAKTYRIQAKTDITQYAVHVDNARIKITLK